MELLRVNLHSAVDVITNSSTTIFTYSGGSDKKAIELIDGILKISGCGLVAKDIFYMGVFLDDFNSYFEQIGDDYCTDGDYDRNLMKEEGCSEDFISLMMDDIEIDTVIKQILTGKIDKPEWMEEAEDYEDSYNGYRPDTTLYVLPKKDEYKDVAEMVTNFLYSTQHEAVYE